MRIEEAKAIGDYLLSLPVAKISPIINIGSGSGKFRAEEQPHINKYIFDPLEQAGVKVVHADLRDEPGVDIVGNLGDPYIRDRIARENGQFFLLNNFLEHVTDIDEFSKVVEGLMPASSHIVVTVPYSYPYHLDPIDNYFRPTPEEIDARFEGCNLVAGEVIVSTTYASEIASKRGSELLRFFVKTFVRLPLPFLGWEAWKSRYHRWLWLFRPYKVSLAVLKRNESGPKAD